MDPLTQDQVAALERAALDADALMETMALVKQRRAVLDWSLWEAVAVQGVPARGVARAVCIGRTQVRMAVHRVRTELVDAEDAYAGGQAPDGVPLLWPPY